MYGEDSPRLLPFLDANDLVIDLQCIYIFCGHNVK